MPKAVGSNSTPASDGQPDDFTALFELTANAAFRLIDRMISARLERQKLNEPYNPALIRNQLWPELFERIDDIVSTVYADHGLNLPEPGNGRPTSQYFHMVRHKLGASRDQFEAGSLLPWIEMKIRRDAERVSATLEAGTSDTISLRDQIISQKAREGISPADLSQAFNLRRSAIDRIIARLTDEPTVTKRSA
ncbi:hypothetical protein [Rhizobium sp. CSW-27]|uniref:hypothetical protein n=1 Tax=Rhizobium sp. CSW-27 TaxID=2839985 RepID=UPI001C01657A|nr:hypothetical protein [Rhizobium sp. CSW-27]MBT9373436.1 hypothetical protein [Rhizobium sp. CSW-27]